VYKWKDELGVSKIGNNYLKNQRVKRDLFAFHLFLYLRITSS